MTITQKHRQLKSGFRRTVNWNVSITNINAHTKPISRLLNLSKFSGVSIPFVLPFENITEKKHTQDIFQK